MEESFWHLADDLNKLPAKEVLKNILRDDKRNSERAEAEFIEDIKLLDDAITLYIESLQAAYIYIDKWKDNISNRAAIAMIVSTLNYILLARHAERFDTLVISKSRRNLEDLLSDTLWFFNNAALPSKI